MASRNEKLAARKAKKDEAKSLASLLGKELDDIAQADKDREAALKGEVTYKLYQTLYAYKSDDPEDLAFEANEIVRVYDDEGDWFEGENQQGEKGCFPSTYVREIKGPAGGAMAIGGVTQ